ncbi:MAG: hypothetical protein QW255_01725 [Candidatus Bilamarchaeaceae archaeon]
MILKMHQKNTAEMLKDLADIEERSEGKIKISVTANIQINKNILDGLKKEKDNFVASITKIIMNSINGEPMTSYTLDVGDKELAEKFTLSLKKELNLIEKPKNNEVVKFENTKIAPDELPLKINTEDSIIEVK